MMESVNVNIALRIGLHLNTSNGLYHIGETAASSNKILKKWFIFYKNIDDVRGYFCPEVFHYKSKFLAYIIIILKTM